MRLQQSDEVEVRLASGGNVGQYAVIDIDDQWVTLLRAKAPPNTDEAFAQVRLSWIRSPDAECRPWPFVVEAFDTVPDWLDAVAHRAHVCVKRVVHGFGVVAKRTLPAGHLIPYGGCLTGLSRRNSVYTVQVALGVFVCADAVSERGPAAYCNDPTVSLVADDGILVRRTHLVPNAQMVFVEPRAGYIDEWTRGENDGKQGHLYVETLCTVVAGDEVTVQYGEDYWNYVDDP